VAKKIDLITGIRNEGWGNFRFKGQYVGGGDFWVAVHCNPQLEISVKAGNFDGDQNELKRHLRSELKERL